MQNKRDYWWLIQARAAPPGISAAFSYKEIVVGVGLAVILLLASVFNRFWKKK
ncbi:MAG: hypothetical protein MRERC_5c079 [Mycoplasmataceae bacterium RC_NB112A]|nr:MAG: hypothetical protein MRERC_5c079 [Mycoplasmataceae bacterium RC_NB112A]